AAISLQCSQSSFFWYTVDTYTPAPSRHHLQRSPQPRPCAEDGPMRYVFADCLLDTQLYTLSRAGRVIPLRPTSFQVLRYLLEHRDPLVSKEELCAHVWPEQFISDATIEGCIKRARQAIGDTGRAQRLIETRRGYGYRFIGAVEAQPAAPPAPAAPTQDDTHRRPEPALLPEEETVVSSAGAVSPAPCASLVPRMAPAPTVHGGL